MTTDLRERLQAALGEHYRLEVELGGGGMSRVFLAEDTTLGRRVVVKVLAPDLTQELSAERFAREIRISARLQHPNIVPVLAAGTAGTLPYYTMPYVEGESLRRRLDRPAPDATAPLAEMVAILRDIARALAYAHERGVIHRDIKPENVLLSGDAAVVADFGIAKAIDAARERTATEVTLTQLGTALGTPAYMAPEQAAGDVMLDYRVDIYAWGVLSYESLAGVHPFSGKRTAHALIVAHLTETPRPLEDLRPDLPTALIALVTACLAKDPAHRPATARELVDVLGMLTSTTATPPSSIPVSVSRVVRASSGPSPVPSVAVLPFVNTSGDADNEPFSDGLTDELIGALGKVPGLKVAGRTSTFALKGRGLGLRAVAETLGVGTVLEGSVRRAGRRLRITTQLIAVQGEHVLWAETYDRELADIFAVQEEIAQAIVGALRVRLSPDGGHGGAPPRLVAAAPANLDAYEFYLKGRFVRRRFQPEDLRRAIWYFEQAVARDPEYARAYAALCDAHVLLVVFAGEPTRAEVDHARAYAATAVSLDAASADAHWALAHVLFALELDFAAAGREFRLALALDPGHGDARHMNAILLLDLRRFDEAISELTRTLSDDPLLAEASMTLGHVYMSVGRFDDAVARLRDALELAPNFSYARSLLGHAYLLQGREDEALAEFRHAVATGAANDRAQLAYACAVTGRRAEAVSILEELLTVDSGHYAPPLHVAMAYTGLGDVNEAFRWLERACDEHDPHVAGLNILTAFVPLRPDPRFGALVRRLGLVS